MSVNSRMRNGWTWFVFWDHDERDNEKCLHWCYTRDGFSRPWHDSGQHILYFVPFTTQRAVYNLYDRWWCFYVWTTMGNDLLVTHHQMKIISSLEFSSVVSSQSGKNLCRPRKNVTIFNWNLFKFKGIAVIKSEKTNGNGHTISRDTKLDKFWNF